MRIKPWDNGGEKNHLAHASNKYPASSSSICCPTILFKLWTFCYRQGWWNPSENITKHKINTQELHNSLERGKGKKERKKKCHPKINALHYLPLPVIIMKGSVLHLCRVSPCQHKTYIQSHLSWKENHPHHQPSNSQKE